jgi:hypothetical protein
MPHNNREVVRNSPADRTTGVEKRLCCVTTRRRAEPFPLTESRWPMMVSEIASAALVLPRRASDAPRARPVAPAAASLLASDARPADNPAPGSTAGSTAVLDKAVHSPWQGKLAIPAATPWSNHPRRRYAAYDPWEQASPLGQPGEDVGASSSGTYPLVFCLVLNRRLATAFPHAVSLGQKARDTREGGSDTPQ